MYIIMSSLMKNNFFSKYLALKRVHCYYKDKELHKSDLENINPMKNKKTEIIGERN